MFQSTNGQKLENMIELQYLKRIRIERQQRNKQSVPFSITNIFQMEFYSQSANNTHTHSQLIYQIIYSFHLMHHLKPTFISIFKMTYSQNELQIELT